MSYWHVVACILCASMLSACGKGEDTDEQYGNAAALLSAKDNGAPALIDHLHKNLKVENGIVVVDGPIVPGAVTLSRNSPWSVSCGDGLTVNIGKGEIDLVPAAVQIADDKCATLTRKLGTEVQAIVDGKR